MSQLRVLQGRQSGRTAIVAPGGLASTLNLGGAESVLNKVVVQDDVGALGARYMEKQGSVDTDVKGAG